MSTGKQNLANHYLTSSKDYALRRLDCVVAAETEGPGRSVAC